MRAIVVPAANRVEKIVVAGDVFLPPVGISPEPFFKWLFHLARFFSGKLGVFLVDEVDGIAVDIDLPVADNGVAII